MLNNAFLQDGLTGEIILNVEPAHMGLGVRFFGDSPVFGSLRF